MSEGPGVELRPEHGSKEPTWQDLKTWSKLAAWESKSPSTAARLIDILEAERRHSYRIEWAAWYRQMAGLLLGFGCVVVTVILAWHYADLGSPFNGAVVMGAGTASTVTIFVTGRSFNKGPETKDIVNRIPRQTDSSNRNA